MKKRDLKLDSQLTEIDKREEGEIAGEEWNLLLRPVAAAEWIVTGVSGFGELGFDFMLAERKAVM